MFGFGNRTTASFSGSVYDNSGHMADIELDGCGRYQGSRKLWRYRLVKGQVNSQDECEMRMDNRSRQVRFAADSDSSNYGYVELL